MQVEDPSSAEPPPPAGLTEKNLKPLAQTYAQFCATRWSEILRAKDSTDPRSDQALERLCRNYWPPIYAFIRRRSVRPAEAQDLTQGFFAHLLGGDWLADVSPDNGKFRTFLLKCLTNYLSNEAAKERTLKRGGEFIIVPLEFETEEGRYSHEPAVHVTPEKEFERRWVCALLDRVTKRLREDYVADGKGEWFEVLQDFITVKVAAGDYETAAAKLQASEGAIKVAVHRLRRRFGVVLRQEVSQTVNDPSEVDSEVRQLFAAWGAS